MTWQPREIAVRVSAPWVCGGVATATATAPVCVIAWSSIREGVRHTVGVRVPMGAPEVCPDQSDDLEARRA